MKTLIKMVDYISKIETEFNMPTKPFDKNYYFGKMLNYASFLRQKLELWMFAPCKLVEGVWVVLEEPLQYRSFIDLENEMDDDIPLKVLHNCKEYKEAKERCLFTKNPYDLQILKKFIEYEYTLELLDDIDLELTPTIQKQFEL